MRYFIELRYDGSAYSGWQRQPDAASVQEIVEDRLSNILGYPAEITGCGRTDKGVHARQYFAHLDMEKEPDENFLFRIIITFLRLSRSAESSRFRRMRMPDSMPFNELIIIMSIFEKIPFWTDIRFIIKNQRTFHSLP